MTTTLTENDLPKYPVCEHVGCLNMAAWFISRHASKPQLYSCNAHVALMLDTQGSSRVQPIEAAPAEPRPFRVGEPDSLADLRRRVEALEAKLATTISGVVAPPMPPVPEVPECGYWERDGKRYVLTEPVEWRMPTPIHDYYVGICGCGQAHNLPEDRFDETAHGGYRFILRELTPPTPPQGYEIDGWGKPSSYEFHTKDGTLLVSCNPQDYFAWCLRPVKPSVRRYTTRGFLEGPDVHLLELPVISRNGTVNLDRELIGVEWAAKWLECEGVKADNVGALSYALTRLNARLADIREEKR